MEVLLRSNLNLPVRSGFNQANAFAAPLAHARDARGPFRTAKRVRAVGPPFAILAKLFPDSSLIRKSRYRLTTRGN